MSLQQVERRQAIARLSAKLKTANGPKATEILERIDRTIAEAAAVDRIETPKHAIASLEIALEAMGADLRNPLPHERLIMHAICFLQMLTMLAGAYQESLAPCIGGHAVIVSKMTGLA